MKKELVWNVLLIDINSKNLKNFNVFNSLRFYKGLIGIKKQFKKRKIDISNMSVEDYSWFSEQVRIEAACAFWSKCEYEVLVSELFTKISKEEVERIKEENMSIKNYLVVNIDNCYKIDVYYQLRLNWDLFIKYILENIKLI